LANYTNLDEILCVVREYGVIQCAAIDDRVQEFVFTMEVAASAHPRNVGCTVKVRNTMLFLFEINSPLSTPIHSSWDGI
jgi:hypothetical protein